ncbi:MAG: GH92 family glycosyl hydrolase [FCB group bacterium]|jgi:predicted alpha-1,2-mannosidase
MKKIFLILVILFSFMQNGIAQTQDYTQYVNPFIGTGSKPNSLSGSVFPGPCMPFGLCQLSPDTYTDPEEPASAYGWEQTKIYGFSHTHLNGTGVGDLYDVLMMPTTGIIKTEQGNDSIPNSGYGSAFSHDGEKASIGYYTVVLKDYNVKAELTATSHCGMHRYTYPATDFAHVIIDMNHSVDKKRPYRVCRIISAQLRIIDDHTIEGYRIITGWSRLRKIYFVAKFSKPFSSTNLYYIGKDNITKDFGSSPVVNGINIKASLNFKTNKDEQILVKVGLSTIDFDGARKNLESEIKDWNFDTLVSHAKVAWNKELGKIYVEGTKELKETFYTGLYRNFIQPNNLADVDGRYIAPDYSIQVSKSGGYYSTFSLWDTYRAAHPLYTLIQPEKDAEFINTMLIMQSYYGYLPIWHLWGDENYCMIGNHAIPVIADAMFKGNKGFDYEKAYQACKASSTIDHLNCPWSVLNKYHYMPEDIQTQSVSLTLELAYDDWCVAQMARFLGKEDDYAFFILRSANYKNLYDYKTNFFRAKNKDGNWMEPFDPLEYGGNGGFPFTEGNAWQYFWYVPQDVPGLIKLLGGNEQFTAKLDTFFTLNYLPKEVNGNASGFIGQDAQGNEPSHHCVYLYDWSETQWLAQYYSSKIQNELYDNTIYGLCGNEDCGQMSAWYIFSAMGFYPVNPANGVYAIGSPSVPKAVIHLAKGKDFTIITKNAGKEQPYIQSVKLNGKAYNKAYLLHKVIMNGGTIEFTMGEKPNKKWGREKDAVPPDWGY